MCGGGEEGHEGRRDTIATQTCNNMLWRGKAAHEKEKPCLENQRIERDQTGGGSNRAAVSRAAAGRPPGCAARGKKAGRVGKEVGCSGDLVGRCTRSAGLPASPALLPMPSGFHAQTTSSPALPPCVAVHGVG